MTSQKSRLFYFIYKYVLFCMHKVVLYNVNEIFLAQHSVPEERVYLHE